MKKIAFALSIVLSISLMGCAATTTTKGVAPASAPVQAQTAKVADSAPVTTQAQTQSVAPAPVVSAGGWTTTNTWSGDKGITTDPFDANGEPILINMVTTSNIPFQIYVVDNTGNTVFVIDKVKANWGVDKKLHR